MSPAGKQPKPDRRPSRIVPYTVAILTSVAAVGVAFLFYLRADAAPGRAPAAVAAPSRAPAAVGRPRNVEIVLGLRTDLPSQYQNVVFLPERKPVALTLDYQAPALAGFEQRIRWSTDKGRLEETGSTLRNQFTPPLQSAVSTIQAKLSFHGRQSNGKVGPGVLEKTATLKVISPSPQSYLRNGVIDGFRIGEYLDPRAGKSRKGIDVSDSYAMIHPEKFLPPASFYLVDDESRDLRISRHFRLGDFVLDYPWFSLGKRQYIALDYAIVQKLEALIADLNRAGLAGDKMILVYGFRSPDYNLGRMQQDGEKTLKAPFSLHQYGKAADFIIDADGDLRLDDLDGDGLVSVRDAGVMAHYVNALDRRYREQDSPLVGGAGVYDHHDFWERPVQSPYVHMDTRNFLDASGHLVRWPRLWPGTKEPIDWGAL